MCLTVGYIFSKYVHCDLRFLVEKIAQLLCFLDGFVLLLFWYLVIRNIQLGHQVYNNCTRLWPTKWYRIIKFDELLLMFCTLFKRQNVMFSSEILRFPVYKQYMYSQ